MPLSDNNFGLTLDERVGASVSPHQKAIDIASKRLRVAIPGVVQSFDAAKQTVTVQPALMENVRVAGVLQSKPLPPLVDVPIVFPRAGVYVLTMPIVAGDECLVIFADMCIDAWYQLGAASTPQKQMIERRHDLSDAFAILGCWSQPRAVTNYQQAGAQLRTLDGTVAITITPNAAGMSGPTVSISATGTMNVQGSTVNVTGSSQVNISGNGHTTIEGKDFLTHTHTGVSTGGGTSGPVL
jgi:hypothetical protein